MIKWDMRAILGGRLNRGLGDRIGQIETDGRIVVAILGLQETQNVGDTEWLEEREAQHG